MVDYLSQDDVIALCDGLCDGLKPPTTLWPDLARTVQLQVREVAATPQSTYMPRHKWLEFISGCVSHAVAIAQETQLRSHEARAMLHQLIGKDTPLRKQFEYDCALEQARYEPIMLVGKPPSNKANRASILHKRWQAMRAVQQEHHPLSTASLLAVDNAVHAAIAEEDFAEYRIGPMLQFFADILLHAATSEEDGSVTPILESIGKQSPLWRRFALKSARFSSVSAAEHSAIIWPSSITTQQLH